MFIYIYVYMLAFNLTQPTHVEFYIFDTCFGWVGIFGLSKIFLDLGF